MLKIRDASLGDLERIMAIYSRAQDYMIESGNPTQWGRIYPATELIKADIERKVCKIVCDDSGIHGVFALFGGDEPTYKQIEGAWLNDAPYLTIHRIASDGIAHGVFACAADYCKDLASNVRIDTHEDNKTMQHLIEKAGFAKCGIIHVSDGSPRIAYQWAKE